MYGKSISEIGNFRSAKGITRPERSRGFEMSTALFEARDWADALMQKEFHGRGDREKSVRARVSKKTGVPESYLFRLTYKTREMRDVAGSVYRALKIAYDEMCAHNEAMAEQHKRDRLKLERGNDAGDPERDTALLGVVETAI